MANEGPTKQITPTHTFMKIASVVLLLQSQLINRDLIRDLLDQRFLIRNSRN